LKRDAEAANDGLEAHLNSVTNVIKKRIAKSRE